MNQIQTSTIAITLLSLVLAASCANDDANVGQHHPDPGETLPENYQEKDSRKLDLLFVVDNSNSMRDSQVSMAANIDAVIEQLRARPEGLPSLHIGVVSSDMGAGPYNITGCEGAGDSGLLQLGSEFDPNCPLVTTGGERFITVPGDLAGVENNIEGIAEQIACNVELGVTGCGFEQPLASMRRALELSGGLNGDFIREDAHLAVIILSDEDDCSAHDQTIFSSDVSLDSISSSLGFLSSYRCAEFGLLCDDEELSRSGGSYESCVPRENSPYLSHPDEFVTYLSGLKGSSRDVTVTVIAGSRNGLEVSVVEGEPRLATSCQSADNNAAPAYRLGYFAEQFPNHLVSSICDANLAGAMQMVGTSLREGLEEGQ